MGNLKKRAFFPIFLILTALSSICHVSDYTVFAALASIPASQDVATDSTRSVNKSYTVIDSDVITDNSGSRKVNWVGSQPGYTYERSAVRFSLAGITGTITNAAFKFYVVDVQGTAVVNLISTIDGSWNERDDSPAFPIYTATDIIYDSAIGPSAPYFNVSVTSGWKTFNVKDYIQSMLDAGKTEVIFVLTGIEGTGTNDFNFVSNQDSDTNSWSKLDLTYTPAPAAPSVSGTTPTVNTRPAWSWTSGGGGSGTYRYKLDNNDLTSGATTTTLSGYTPGSDLSEGSHTLYVQESNGASPVGWSNTGSFTIVVDTTPPAAPVVTGTTPVNNTAPTWTWSPGGGGNGNYRYKFDNSDLTSGATTAAAMSCTPVSALTEGVHTLYVQERDAAGNWSTSGSCAITIDVTPPGAPAVTGTTPTQNTRPTWSWTPGSGGNGSFRYKLDNSDLTNGTTTTSTTGYTPASALAEGVHTLYVQERDAAGNWSSSGSFAITIDTTVPNAPVVSGTTPTNNTTPTWTWTTGGGGGTGSYRYKLDDSDLTSGAATTSAMSCTAGSALGEGVHTLYVQERNTVGNWSASGSFAITIDTTGPNAPVVTGTTPTNDTSPTWAWTTGGGGGTGNYRYKLDNSNLTSGATTASAVSCTAASALTEGVHTLYVQERDAVGNWSASGSFAITIDTTGPNAPVATGTTPTNSTTPTWTWTTGGGGGTGSYRYKLDGSDLTSGATTTSSMSCTAASALGEGAHTLYVQERDAAGNWSSSGSFAITIDTAAPNAPAVTGTTPTNDTSPAWTWTSGGGGTGNYRYKLDDSNVTSGAATTSTTAYTPASALTEGVHTLYVQERDAAGNWSASGSFAITIDATGPNAPVVTGTTPTNDTTPAWTWTSGGGGGTGSYRYKLDNSDLTSGATTTSAVSCTAASALGEGVHTLYVQERDAVGNWSASGSFAITIDTTGPNAPVVTGTTPTNDTSPTWAWTTGGGGGTGNYRYKLDNSNLTSGATTASAVSCTAASALTEGVHTLYVQERDAVGNWSASGSFAITIDATGPNAPVVTGTTPTNSTTPTWTWTTGGGGGTGSYRYKLDGSDLTSGTTTTSSMSCTAASALGEGAHTLYVQERDAAGNWSSSGSFAITIDTAAPNAPAVTGTTPTNDASPAWTWTSGGGGTGNYRYKLDNNNLTSGATTTSAMSYTSANALTEGIHTLYVQERDTAGNWSASGSFAIKVDTTSPTVSSVDVPADDTYLSGRNLDFTVNFTENVTASSNAGTPYITLTLNTGGVVHATYISGSGTTALVFRYTIASGNDDTDGVLAGGVITANGGTLKDAAGNNAVLSLNNVGSTANVRVDAKVPALTGAARTDNTHITAALSENCTNISRTDNGGFAVLETGTPGTAYTVSSIAQGTDAKHIVLTVADMSISAKEGITVKYTAGVSGAIQDMAGNAMETDNAGISINGWDVAPPAIVSATLASNNEYIDITFSEGIYNADDGAAAITKDKLVLSFTKGSGSATNVQIKSVRKHDDSVVTSASALSGGETIVRVFLEITGIPNGAEKIMIKPADGASLYDKAGNAMAAAQTTGEKTLNNQQPVQSNDNQQPSTAPPSNPPPVKEDKPVIDAPTTVDVKKEDGKTVTIATVDDKKLEEMLKTEDNGSTITIPVNNGSDVVTGQLNGQTIKAMEDKEAVLEIKTENVTYTLPASQINIDSISGQLGSQVALKDIKVNITIAEPSQNTVKIVEDTANKNSYQIVVKPVEFEITCTSAGKTVDVSRFNGYVERTIAIPDGVDPSKITTGIVLNNDGTFSHVPTTIVVIDGKYYAKINSLTNSTYSVIWNPKTFADMEKHWAKADVNDLASRLIIEGIDKDHYAPDQKITRAEYVTTLVKALGIMKPGTGKAVFNDVDRKARYYDAVGIAYEYGLITGNGNGGFKPEDKITREEALTILVRSMMLVKLNAKATDGEIKQLLGKYHDNGKISTWAREAVAVCIRNQIITGSGNRIMAKDNITRAETAAIVKRLLKKALLI